MNSEITQMKDTKEKETKTKHLKICPAQITYHPLVTKTTHALGQL